MPENRLNELSLFSGARPAEDYSEQNYSDSTISDMSNGTTTVSKSSPSESKTDTLTKPQSLQTCVSSYSPVRLESTEDLQTWLQAAFPARIYRLQIETPKALPEKGQDYGEQCATSFAKYDLNTHLWRIHQLSLFEDLNESLEIWPRQGMTVGGYAYELPDLAHLTNETEFGYMPTPRASMGKPCSKRLGKDSAEYRHNIEEYLIGKPNPTFCEWMMGWPMMWTSATKRLETGKFRQWLEQHGKS